MPGLDVEEMKKRIALALIVAAVVSALAWVETGKKRFGSALNTSGNDSKEVVLERYYSGTVIHTARMSASAFKARMDQLPAEFGRLRHTTSKCWIPHHRIKFVGTPDNKIEICFTCNEILTEAVGRRKIPEEWRQPLRSLFVDQGISDGAPDSDDLTKHYDAIVEELEQPNTPNKPHMATPNQPPD